MGYICFLHLKKCLCIHMKRSVVQEECSMNCRIADMRHKEVINTKDGTRIGYVLSLIHILVSLMRSAASLLIA